MIDPQEKIKRRKYNRLTFFEASYSIFIGQFFTIVFIKIFNIALDSWQGIVLDFAFIMLFGLIFMNFVSKNFVWKDTKEEIFFEKSLLRKFL